MEKIPDTFLIYASDILAHTETGLSGSEIVRYFLAKSVQENVNIIHARQPFKDIKDKNINKKTAFFQNLSCFQTQVQYEIIIDLCEKHDRRGFANLMELTKQRYGNFETTLTPELSKTQTTQILSTNQYGETISDHIFISQLNIENQKKMQTIDNKPKPWYKQPEVLPKNWTVQ